MRISLQLTRLNRNASASYSNGWFYWRNKSGRMMLNTHYDIGGWQNHIYLFICWREIRIINKFLECMCEWNAVCFAALAKCLESCIRQQTSQCSGYIKLSDRETAIRLEQGRKKNTKTKIFCWLSPQIVQSNNKKEQLNSMHSKYKRIEFCMQMFAL